MSVHQQATALITNYHLNKQPKPQNITRLEHHINSYVNAPPPPKPSSHHRRKEKLNEYVQLQEKLDSLEHKIQSIKSTLFDKEPPRVATLSQHNKYFINIRIENKEDKSQPKPQPSPMQAKQPFSHSQSMRLLHPRKDPRMAYYLQEMPRVLDPRDQSASTHLLRDALDQSIDSVRLSQSMNGKYEHEYQSKRVKLSQKYYYSNKKTLVLDLDETLLHCNQHPDRPSEVVLPITLQDGQQVQVGINIRPFAREFIKELSFYYELIVFTASHSCYADPAIDLLDPSHQYIQHRLFREQCVYTAEEVYVKDLRVLGRPLENVVLVDNAAYSFAFQPHHGVPILPFYDDPLDNQLFLLCKFLKSVHAQEDLPGFLKRHFQVGRYGEFESGEALVRGLYT